MRVIVTGAAGFVGRHLVPSLAVDHDVICLVRQAEAVRPISRASILECDLRASSWLHRLPAQADVIIHLAQSAGTFPDAADDLFAVNAASTQRLADYARRAGARRFIFASSGSVYASSSSPLLETDPIAPVGFYATTKAISEMILRPYQAEFGVSVLRVFAPYGPGQLSRMIPRLIAAVRDGDPVTVVNGGSPRINPIHVADLVQVLRLVLGLVGSQTVNVAGPDVVSVREIAMIAANALGREPIFVEEERADATDLIADTSNMTALFPTLPLVPASDGIGSLAREMATTRGVPS